MELFRNIWRRFSHSKALDDSSGQLETDFFESVYRVNYIAGLSSADEGFGYRLYRRIAKIIIISLICGEIWHGLTETSSLDELASSISLVVLHFMAIYRYENVVYYKEFFRELASSMNSPYFNIDTIKRRQIVKTWVHRNKTYFNLLLVLGNCTLVAWFIFPPADNTGYSLPIETRLPFDYKTPVFYPIAYTLVAVSFTYIAYFVMMTDLFMQAHLLHLVCQFNVLADCFENLLGDCSEGFEDVAKFELVYNKEFAEKYTQRLGNLVEQHKQILNHTMKLKKILSRPLLGQLGVSVTMLCFVGYQAATAMNQSFDKCVTSILYLLCNLFELYIVCRWCQEITDWSGKIGEAVYCSGWEWGVFRIRGARATIMFVMARAQKPVVFTAGGMYNLSIASYGKLVKTSYSALAALLQFRHD